MKAAKFLTTVFAAITCVGRAHTNSLTNITPGGALSNFAGNLGGGPQNTAIDSSGNF